ncbi:MAG: TIR domain-containing protein [Thermodesulfobacteriota bacterium]
MIDNFSEIRQRRFKFIKHLYELSGGDRYYKEKMWDIGENLGFTKKETTTIVQYLQGEGLINSPTMDGYISITHPGITFVEKALSEKEQSSIVKFADPLIDQEFYSRDRLLQETLSNIYESLVAKGAYRSGANIRLTQEEYEKDIKDRARYLVSLLKDVAEKLQKSRNEALADEMKEILNSRLEFHTKTLEETLRKHGEKLQYSNPERLSLPLQGILKAAEAEINLFINTPVTVEYSKPGIAQEVESMKVFISHSDKDVAVAETLIDLLRSALNLKDIEIRCTSVDGYRLPIGADTDEQLRREILDAAAFIGIISRLSLQSAYVMFELGARWGSRKYLAPLLAPGCDAGILEGPLKGLNALRCDNGAQLHQLIQDIAKELNLQHGNPAAYQKYIDKILSLT